METVQITHTDETQCLSLYTCCIHCHHQGHTEYKTLL